MVIVDVVGVAAGLFFGLAHTKHARLVLPTLAGLLIVEAWTGVVGQFCYSTCYWGFRPSQMHTFGRTVLELLKHAVYLLFVFGASVAAGFAASAMIARSASANARPYERNLVCNVAPVVGKNTTTNRSHVC